MQGLRTDLSGKVTLGFWAEDAAVVRKGRNATAPLYSLELLSDAIQVALRLGGTTVSVRADKFFKAAIGEPISIHVPSVHCHLFDVDTGQRLG